MKSVASLGTRKHRRQSQPLQKADEAWIRAKGVERRLDGHLGHVGRALLDRTLEPRQRVFMVAERNEHMRYRVGLQITRSFGLERLREEQAGFVSPAASRITPRELQIGKGLTAKQIERPTQPNDPLLAPSSGNERKSKHCGGAFANPGS